MDAKCGPSAPKAALRSLAWSNSSLAQTDQLHLPSPAQDARRSAAAEGDTAADEARVAPSADWSEESANFRPGENFKRLFFIFV